MTNALILMILGGCTAGNETKFNACRGEVTVQIFEPVDFSLFPQGGAFSVGAMVRDTCGYDLQEAGQFVLSSSAQQEIIIDYSFIDENEVSIELKEPLDLGEHVLSLKVTNQTGDNGEDEVNVSITENTPPGISLRTPDETGEAFAQSAGAKLVADVSDAEEDLSTLSVRWVIDGEVYPGPENANTN